MRVRRKIVWMKEIGHHGESFCKLCNVSGAYKKHNMKSRNTSKSAECFLKQLVFHYYLNHCQKSVWLLGV